MRQNPGQGISQLATSAHAAESAALSLSHQVDHSLSSALTHNTQYMQSHGHNDALGTQTTMGVNTHVDHAMTTISSLTHSLAKKENITTQDAFQKLSKASVSASVGFGFDHLGIKLGASANVEGSSSSRHEANYSVGADKNISASDARDFREAVSTVQNYSETHSYSDHNTAAQNLAVQMGADLNNAERLSSSANYIQSHSDAINTNFSQAFANYVQTHYPSEANAILSATGDSPLLAKQQQLADQFVQTHAKKLANQFSSASSDVQRGFSSSVMQHRQKYAVQNYQKNADNLTEKGGHLGVNEQHAQQLKNRVGADINRNESTIAKNKQRQKNEASQFQSSVDNKIDKGKHYSEKGVTRHIIDKVEKVL